MSNLCTYIEVTVVEAIMLNRSPSIFFKRKKPQFSAVLAIPGNNNRGEKYYL